MIVQLLIEAACADTSRAKVAREIGVSPQFFSMIENGKQACPAWVAARLGELAGKDPARCALEALEENSKTENERQTWQRLLHKLKIDNAGKRAK